MLNYLSLLSEVKAKISAYNQFLKSETGTTDLPEKFESLPLLTKQSYLMKYKMEELCRAEDLQNFHLIGASSGFSKTGAIYWPKRPCDEAGYMNALETMFVTNYHIDTRRTLVIECLAFGMWIGGMQIAAAMRYIALSGKYHFTLATPGLDLKAAASVIDTYHQYFDQILIITNPSNISLIQAILKDKGTALPDGFIYFPVVGEYYTESFREHVCCAFGHPVDSPYVVWTGYGSADTGDISAETESTIRLRKFFFHHPELSEQWFGTHSTPMILAISSNVYLELIDGKIVVTKDQFIPLVRYNTGDAGALLPKKSLQGIVPDELYSSLPEEMMYVFGRADNAVIFYGTNLMINDIIEYLLSLPAEKCYGGLFTVHERMNEGINCFDFTIYVTDTKKADAEDYYNLLIDYLCKSSAEFNIKYQNLSKSVDTPLITVRLSDILKLDNKIKHRYII